MTNWLLANFSQNKPEAIERYKAFVDEGLGGPSIWSSLHKQIYLGNSAFVEEEQSLLNENQPLSENPSTQIKPVPVSLDNYCKKSRPQYRYLHDLPKWRMNVKINSDVFSLHYSTISG